MEMEELPPSRQPTLESQLEASQRQRRTLPSILERLRGQHAASSQVSDPLDDTIAKAARRYSDDAQRFLNDFRHMSRRPKARLHEVFDIFIRLPHRPNDTVGAYQSLACVPLKIDCCCG